MTRSCWPGCGSGCRRPWSRWARRWPGCSMKRLSQRECPTRWPVLGRTAARWASRATVPPGVSLSAAAREARLSMAWRRYRPEGWAGNRARRGAGEPKKIGFQTKPAVALDMIRRAVDDGVPAPLVPADAASGNDAKFRSGPAGLGLDCVLGVQGSANLWRPREEQLPAKKRKKTGGRGSHSGRGWSTGRLRLAGRR